MDEIGIDIDVKDYADENEYVDQNEYVKQNDEKSRNVPESVENMNYKAKTTYIGISPDGSIVATFNLLKSLITIKKIAKNEEYDMGPKEIVTIPVEMNKFFDSNFFDSKSFFDKKPQNILGWSLAVSDIIDEDLGFVAISCITEDDMNPKGIDNADLILIVFDLIKQALQRFIKVFIHYCLVIFFILYILFVSLPIPWSVTLLCLVVLINLFYLIRLCTSYYITNRGDVDQFRLPWISSKGMTRIYKFSFSDEYNPSVHAYINGHVRLGGIINFLKDSKHSLKNCAILVCTNYIKIQKIIIKLKGGSKVSEEVAFLLPENLFEELKGIKDAKRNWDYLLKSSHQEFLMVDTNYNKQIHNIELYNVNTAQLVNVFHRNRNNSLTSKNNEPGAFAISTDSRLLAYSYRDNIITLYLMESGIEIVSKKIDNISKIKYLEFIEKDKKLLIVEDVKEGDVKFHVWLLSGCLNDYFDISRENIDSSYNISILSNYNTITKANGKVVFCNDMDDNGQFEVVREINIERTTFGENDIVTDEYEYISRDLEPWNVNGSTFRGRFLNNDKRYLLIIGQNSIQLWKSKSLNFIDFNNFKDFDNSDLIYILINDDLETEKKSDAKFQIDDDMTTIISHACKSLAYLHKHDSNINKEKRQKFVGGITNIIKDFIDRYPDNWKLMEVQYPLMAYLIYSRSFSLIKHILFENETLHRPQSKYVSYPHYVDLKLYGDFDDDHSSKSGSLEDNVTNDLELALNFDEDQDSVMLAYLLEYYSENAMNHYGWMINVTKILSKLPTDYSKSLFYKPCFGGIKSNFLNKRFKSLSDSLNLKVHLPVTWLIEAKSLNFFKYKTIRNEELPNIYVVPFSFSTFDNNSKVEKHSEKGFISNFLNWLRKLLFPHSFDILSEKEFSPFLQIKNVDSFFDVPVIETFLTSRWPETKIYWMVPLVLYAIFLYLFSILSEIYLDDSTETDKYSARNLITVIIFYYVGIYLLLIEFMQILKYGMEYYYNIFNVFDMCSFICGLVVFTFIFAKSFNENNGINNEGIVILITITTLILWIEVLLWLRLFTGLATYIYIFGSIIVKIIPFFVFFIVLTISFGHSMYVLFRHPTLLDLGASPQTFTLFDGTQNLTLTGQPPNNPFDTIWDAILSAYNWGTTDLSNFSYWPLKLFGFAGNVIIVLILLNMIIALMSDTFTKAKEDGNLGIMMFRNELIYDYERLDNPLLSSKSIINNSLYICFNRDSDSMKSWIEKCDKIKETTLYSWFNESVDKDIIVYDKVHIKEWYARISGDENQELATDNDDLWF
ncbi:hypothetical protein RclHR1_04550008 [Rhizophagus clarus]|uniref:Ion transport domain-containing protein n=1 Tax=Rhizophagus clarus TaxID=94130 RepID=A0A2Z6RJL8_9GLOM|nr:hypothetical protein RclHR1_04550008 [Rhizophagus clarus]